MHLPFCHKSSECRRISFASLPGRGLHTILKQLREMGIRAPDWVRISLWLKASICRNRSFDEKDPRRKFLQVSTPKTKASRRTIPLTPKLKEILAEQKRQQAQSRILAGSEWQEHGLVFSTGLGTPLEGRNITRTLHRVLKEAGNEHLGVHALRHSYATMLNDAGVPIKTIQGIIGHADLQTTANRYIHGREEKKQEAVLSVSRLLAI